LLIPCHRIVAANGNMTGFSGPGGVATKVKLLALEGAQLVAE
jgi:methylated-DNA-[protein]-cysteine S-methyltransferase